MNWVPGEIWLSLRAAIHAFFASVAITLAAAVAAALMAWIVLDTFGSVSMILILTFALVTVLFFGAAAVAGHCAARLDQARPILTATLTGLPFGLAAGAVSGFELTPTITLAIASMLTAIIAADADVKRRAAPQEVSK